VTGLLSFVQTNWLTLLVIGGLLIAYVVLRTPPSQIASATEFIEELSQGQVTVVEFYTNT